MQMRLIVGVEQVVAEGKTTLEACSTEEGLKTILETKLKSIITKIESKIGAPDKIEQLTAVNTLREGEKMIDLKERGESAQMSAVSTMEKLSALSSVLASYRCSEEANNLEATATYLLRAIQDATKAQLQLPMAMLKEVVWRHAFGMLRERNILGAAAALDLNDTNPCGINALASTPEVRSLVQAELSVNFVARLLEVPVAENDSNTNKSLVELATELPKRVDKEPIKILCNRLLNVLLVPDDRTDSEVLAAIHKLTDANETDDLVVKKLAYPRGPLATKGIFDVLRVVGVSHSGDCAKYHGFASVSCQETPQAWGLSLNSISHHDGCTHHPTSDRNKTLVAMAAGQADTFWSGLAAW